MFGFAFEDRAERQAVEEAVAVVLGERRDAVGFASNRDLQFLVAVVVAIIGWVLRRKLDVHLQLLLDNGSLFAMDPERHFADSIIGVLLGSRLGHNH